MVFFFAHPVIFYALLLVLLGVSVFAIFSMGQEDAKARKKRHEETEGLKAHAAELEAALQETQKQAQEAAVQAQAKQDSLTQRIAGLEADLQATQSLKSAMAQVKAELAAREDAYAQTARARQELDERIKALTGELEKAQKERALADQMYNGLKGQYDELEERLSRVVEQAGQKPEENVRSEAPLSQRPAPVQPEKPAADTGAAAPVQPPPATAVPFKSFKIPNLRGTVQENGETKTPSSGAAPA